MRYLTSRVTPTLDIFDAHFQKIIRESSVQRSSLVQKRAKFQKTRFCKSVDHGNTNQVHKETNREIQLETHRDGQSVAHREAYKEQKSSNKSIPTNTLSRLSSFRQDTLVSSNSRNSSLFLKPYGSNPFVMTRRSTLSLLNVNMVGFSRESSTRSNRSTKSANISVTRKAWSKNIVKLSIKLKKNQENDHVQKKTILTLLFHQIPVVFNSPTSFFI